MSEPQEQTKAMTVARERLIAEAPAAMFDSAAFEHLQRVATVVYRSGFVPRSLTHDGPGENATELPEAMVVARCILLADQANRSGADVVGYIQATSVINDRLMHEGKLVNAIIQRRLRIRLKYRFGLWNTDHIVFPELVTDKEDPRFGEPVDPNFFHGSGERLALRCYNPESADEYVEGSAGQWKTTRSGSPWSKAADWPRQLRYRAVREWARAYDPGTVLGMIADGDQDIDVITDITPRKSGVMQRLSGEQTGAGFDAEHVERETTPKERVAAKRAARKAATEGADPEEAIHATQTPEEVAEEAKEAAELVLGPQPDATAAESPAEPGVAASPASDGGTGTEVGSEAITEGTGPEGLEAGEEARRATEAEAISETLPKDLTDLITATETVETWADFKQAMGAFQKTGLWPTLSLDQQNHIRGSAWDALTDRAVGWAPDPNHDISAFRLYIESEDNPDQIKATLALLKADPEYQSKSASMREQVEGAADARLADLEG